MDIKDRISSYEPILDKWLVYEIIPFDYYTFRLFTHTQTNEKQKGFIIIHSFYDIFGDISKQKQEFEDKFFNTNYLVAELIDQEQYIIEDDNGNILGYDVLYYVEPIFIDFDPTLLTDIDLINLSEQYILYELYEEAIPYLEEGIKRENPNAMRIISELINYEMVEGYDISLAHFYLEKAASLGDYKAKANLASIYLNTVDDKDKGLSLMEDASEYNGLASYMLGHRYYFGLDGRVDKVKAIELFNRALKDKSIDALYVLGLEYFKGDNLPVDKLKAFKYLSIGANQGYDLAQFQLANSYYLGKDIKENPKRSFYWNKKAADNEIEDACLNHGINLLDGYGCEQDFKEAVKYLKISARMGNKEAKIVLAKHYLREDKYRQHFARAMYWLRQAIKDDDYESMVIYSVIIMERKDSKRYKEIISLLKKAVGAGFPPAYNELGNVYLHGIGVKQNIKTAIKYFKQGTNKGNLKSFYNLGNIYSEGEYFNLKLAIHYLEFAAKQGDVMAKYKLGKLYIENNFDEGKIFELFNELMDLEFSPAYVELGNFYLYKKGNLTKAKNLFDKASHLGNGCGYSSLGAYYFLSDKPDLKNAKKYFEKAQSLDDYQAIYLYSQVLTSLDYPLEKLFNTYKIGKDYDINCCFNYYRCQIEGQGTRVKIKEPLKELTNLVDEYNHCMSAAYLYFLYRDGFKVKQNIKKAIEFGLKAINYDLENHNYNLFKEIVIDLKEMGVLK